MRKRDVTEYVCDYCGHVSTDKAMIEHCEQSHEQMDATVNKMWWGRTDRFPCEVALKSKTGKYIAYYRKEEVKLAPQRKYAND